MDLVSSTLDKYLKHRFNESGLKIQPTPTTKQNDPNNTKSIEHQAAIVTNGISDQCFEQLPNIHNLLLSNNRPCCISMRDDFRFLAAGFENAHIYLWCSSTNSDNESKDLNFDSRIKLLAHSGPVYSIQFVNNNDLMLSCSEDTTIRLWCLKTNCNLTIYRGHNYPVWSLAVGPQGFIFASGSMDTTARLWQLDKISPTRIFCGHDEDVECIKFHPNEKYIATGSSDATIRLWSVADGKMVRLMVGHTSPIVSLSFLPDGKFLASASGDGSIKVWNLAKNCPSSEMSAPASHSVSFSPEQNFVSTCGTDNILRLWRIKDSNLSEVKRLDFGAASRRLVQCMFLGNDKLFAVGFIESEEVSLIERHT